MTVARASVYAVDVQATWAWVLSKVSWNVRWATATTVMSRMDMIAPSTTTPATIMTRRSSLPSEEPAGSPTWLSISVLMWCVFLSSSQVERRQRRRHRRLRIGGAVGCRAATASATRAQVVADLSAQPEGDVGGREQRHRSHDRVDLPVRQHHHQRGADGQGDRLRRGHHDLHG